MSSPQEHINIFIAYSRKDKAYLERLRTYLTPLERNDKIQTWYDGEIVPGSEWEKAIKTHLYSADIILLLISADALASDYFYEKEMTDALNKHKTGQAIVIPVILRPCLWNKNSSLGALQVLPTNGKAVSTWNDEDSANLDIVEGIDKNIQIIKEKRAKQQEEREIKDQQRLTQEKQNIESKRENIIGDKEEKISTTRVNKNLNLKKYNVIAINIISLFLLIFTSWYIFKSSNTNTQQITSKSEGEPYYEANIEENDEIHPEPDPIIPASTLPLDLIAQSDTDNYTDLVAKAETQYLQGYYNVAKFIYEESLTYVVNGREAQDGIAMCNTALEKPLRSQQNIPKVPGGRINWMTFEEVEKEITKGDKEIFVNIHAEWCQPCKLLESSTFSDKGVANFINQNYYAINFDAQSSNPVILKGQYYENPNFDYSKPKGSRNAIHQLAAKYDVRAFPTVLFLDKEFNLIESVKGYRGADKFLAMLYEMNSEKKTSL